MKQAKIGSQPDEVITDDEIVLVTEVCYDTPIEVITTLCAALTAPQRKVCRYHLEVYYDRMDDGVDSIQGGKEALYTDNQVNRLDIANRMRRLLTLPPLSAQQLEDIAAQWRAMRGLSGGSGRRSQSVDIIVSC